jgi:hypothetical protein
MDLESVSLGAGSADFGPTVGVFRHLAAAIFSLSFEPESGMVLAIHRTSKRVRLIHVASGIVMEPTAEALPFKPKDPAGKPLNGNGGRGAAARPPR